jgi:hypothetical protein
VLHITGCMETRRGWGAAVRSDLQHN